MTITAERLRHLLSYDPQLGRFKWLRPTARRVSVGDVAGWDNKSGYRQICIDGKQYYEHRLVWLWSTGKWPKKFIDHIDGNKSNNNVLNLREADGRQNNANSGTRRDNSCGLKGVFFDRRRGAWKAQIKAPGFRRFIGYFDTAEAAHEAYGAAAIAAFGEFARFS